MTSVPIRQGDNYKSRFKSRQSQTRTHLSRRGEGGGVHFKLERSSCQHSLKYIAVKYEGAPFSTETRTMFLCN